MQLTNAVLTDSDLHTILRAIRDQIDESLAEVMKKRKELARVLSRKQPKRAKFSKVPPQSLNAGIDDLKRRVDLVAAYQKERVMNDSATAARIAGETTARKRAAGENVRFRDEYNRILGEFQARPQEAHAKYQREIKKTHRIDGPVYDSKAPAVPASYVSFEQLAAEAAAAIYPGTTAEDRLLRSAKKRELLTALLNAASERQNGPRGMNLYSSEIQQVILRAWASLKTEASDLAMKDAMAKKGAFKDRLAARIEELRQRAFKSLNRSVG